MKHATPLACALLCVMLFLSSCMTAAPVNDRQRESMLALDTVIDINVYGERGAAGLAAAKDTILFYESLLSVTGDNSDVSRVNNSGGAAVEVDPQTATLIARACELCGITGGCFDISIYPVIRAWGFTTAELRVPPPDELAALLEYVDYSKVSADIETHTIKVPDGVMLDLGGVAKGYIGDRAIDALRDAGVTSAIINLGGNVQTLGTKPDGSDWSVSIRDPKKPSDTAGIITIGEGAVITSGGYQRYFTGSDGVKYHHLIDPATGYPAQSGISSVTVVSTGNDSGFYGDGLTTALFVMGLDASLDFWRGLGGAIGDTRFELIVITDGGEVVITPGLADRFTLTSETYSLVVLG